MELELYVREGCSRCRQVSAMLSALEIGASIMDIDDPEVTAKARRLGIRSVPVLRKVATGQMKVGELSEEELLKFLD